MNLYSVRLKNSYTSAVRETCERAECQLKLSGFPRNKVIIDVDDPSLQKKIRGERCDHVIVVDDDRQVFFLLIEIKVNKSDNIDVNKVYRQLTGGVNFFASKLPIDSALRPILVSKKIPPVVQKALGRNFIEYSNKKWPIQPVLCNKNLLWRDVKRAAS